MMNLYKLKVSGNDDEFIVQYSFSTNFITYQDCTFAGNEQDKYLQFLDDLQKHGGPQPINIKMKMMSKSVDRAMAKNKIIGIKDIEELIQQLGR